MSENDSRLGFLPDPDEFVASDDLTWLEQNLDSTTMGWLDAVLEKCAARRAQNRKAPGVRKIAALLSQHLNHKVTRAMVEGYSVRRRAGQLPPES
jgi:hypothetical protein